MERAQQRTRRMESGALSIFVHLAIVGLAILIMEAGSEPVPQNDNVVFVNNPIYLPYEGDGRDGGVAGAEASANKLRLRPGACPKLRRFKWSPQIPRIPARSFRLRT